MKCEKLEVWKRSCRLSVEIYKYFKENKDFAFKEQITKTSLSIPSNIAEGMEKNYPKEKKRKLPKPIQEPEPSNTRQQSYLLTQKQKQKI